MECLLLYVRPCDRCSVVRHVILIDVVQSMRRVSGIPNARCHESIWPICSFSGRQFGLIFLLALSVEIPAFIVGRLISVRVVEKEWATGCRLKKRLDVAAVFMLVACKSN